MCENLNFRRDEGKLQRCENPNTMDEEDDRATGVTPL